MKKFILIVFLLCLAIEQSPAQFFSFGRNKVQYTEFNWQVLRTEHFDVYYYPEMEQLARIGSNFAEESYTLLEQKFNQNVSNRIPLVFYSSHKHFEQTNITSGFIPEGVGGFFEFVKGRVVIPFNGSVAQFKHVIRHELVHVFTYSKISRVLLDHRVAQDHLPPLWFTEGLAEYWSEDWDMQGEMVLRDATMSDYLAPLSEITRISGSYLMYKEGQKILEFACEKYGDEKILLILENFWRSNSFEEVFRYAVGVDYKTFDDEWVYSLKKKYYPLLTHNDFVSRASLQLTTEGFNSKPVFYKRGDNREIYFIGNYSGYAGIYRLSLDSAITKPELVFQGERTEQFEAFHIFESKIDVSKDGILAFTTKKGESDALHLYDVNNNQLLESIQFENLVLISSPSFSPDGKQIVFSSVDKSGFSDLYLFDIVSRSATKITEDLYDDHDPVFSPDGKKIYFSSDRTSLGGKGFYNLFSFDIATKNIDYVTYGSNNYYTPAFSKDGKTLSYACDAGSARNIYTMSTDQLGDSTKSVFAIQKLTKYVTAAFDPVFTDSNEIVFAAFEGYHFHLHTISMNEIPDSTIEHISMAVVPSSAPWKPVAYTGGVGTETRKYKGDYSFDVAQSQISTQPLFGTVGGAFAGMSDLFGNERYDFLVFNTAQTQSEILQSFNIVISRTSMVKRSNFSYGVFRFSGPRYDLTDPDVIFYERSFGGFFSLSYPFSTFHRIELSSSITNSNKESYDYLNERKALFLANGIEYVFDNALWGPSGPLDGSRFSSTLVYTTDVQNSHANYFSMMFDYRKYYRIAQRSTFASRIWIFLNEGQEARRFFMGGSWDLRGWPRWSLRGTKLWLLSEELRFPFLDELQFHFPFGGISFAAIRGALFFDAGNAWTDKYNSTLGSVGGGIRLNFGGIIVLRYDVGKLIENNFNRFGGGVFYQFFFGYDF